MRTGEVRRSARAVVRNPRLLREQAAYGLFAVDEQAQWVAVLLWAYGKGGAGLAGLVAVLQLLPAAALAPVGGIIGDRMPRDRALRLVYGLQVVTMAALAVLIAMAAPKATVVLAAVAAGVVVSWTRPPHYAAAAELSTSPGEAAAANSLSGTLENLGWFVGPVLAGAAGLLGGPAPVIAVCAGMAACAAVLVNGLGLRRPQGAERPMRTVPPPTDDADVTRAVVVPAGLLAALRQRPAAAVVLVLIGAQFLAQGAMEVLGVAFAEQRLGSGAGAVGLLIASVGAGGILGAAAALVLAGRRRLSLAVTGSLLLGALPLLAMPLLSTLAPALLVGVVSGAGLAFFAVAGITLLQRSVDDSLMGRVLAVRESAMLAGLAAGAAAVPVGVRVLGPGRTYAVLGLVLGTVAVLALPVLLRLDRRASFRPEVSALLRGIDFLSVLAVPALERLAQQARPMELAAGTVVIRQGEPGDAYYLVESGRLEVAVAGRPERVVLGPGDGFGEIALLLDVPRTATVSAIESCRLWVIDRSAFVATITGSAGVALAGRQVDERLQRLAPDPSDAATGA